MNLREYINSKKKVSEQNAPQNLNNGEQINTQPLNNGETQDINSVVNKYSSMSEENLMQELFKTANQSRQDGTLDNNSLDNFYNQAASFLTPEQSEKMRSLISELKK